MSNCKKKPAAGATNSRGKTPTITNIRPRNSSQTSRGGMPKGKSKGK